MMRHCQTLDNPYAKRGAVCAMDRALYCDCDCPDCDPTHPLAILEDRR